MHRYKLSLLLFTTLWFGFIQTGKAHDPGLSRSSIQILNKEIQLQLTFAQQDITSIIPLDSNRDGNISDAELDNANQALKTLFSDGINLRVNQESAKITGSTFQITSNDAISVRLNFPYQGQKKLNLALPVIGQFARGHRQHLTVVDRKGALLDQHVLNAGSGEVVIHKTGVGDRTGIFQQYFLEGIHHIWIGFDHILFLVTLILPAVLIYRQQQWQSIDNAPAAIIDTLKVVTAFTLAHSLTLALASFQIVQLPPGLVEPVIALSVLITALNNLRPIFPASRWLLAFIFGLIHGFGFASVLNNLDLPGQAMTLSLLGFNLGVEAGQLAIVSAIFPLAYVGRHTRFYRRWVFNGGSFAAAVIAAAWIFERTFDMAA